MRRRINSELAEILNGKKEHKYKARRTVCRLGHYHPSNVEKEYCDKLQMLKEALHIQDFEYQKSYDLNLGGKSFGAHKPDFTITEASGNVVIHEVKGVITQAWLMKKKLFEACYPDIKYIVIR